MLRHNAQSGWYRGNEENPVPECVYIPGLLSFRRDAKIPGFEFGQRFQSVFENCFFETHVKEGVQSNGIYDRN